MDTNNPLQVSKDQTELKQSKPSGHTQPRRAGGKLASQRPPVSLTTSADPLRRSLAEVAAETIQLLPGLLATRPDVGQDAKLFPDSDARALLPNLSPKLPATRVRVVNRDTIDAALALNTPGRPVCILNMASASHPGGGFKRGALAQEEALCYRSSLFFALKTKFYPIPAKAAIYSPKVLVFRKNLKGGHSLMDLREPSKLPVISVVSAAAICRPGLLMSPGGGQVYQIAKDKELMMEKMRVILRVANRNHHRKLVLGAFGCGAFANPPQEVANMWTSVLQESEFQAGWWEDLVFAVIDGAGTDNFRIFKQTLDGLSV